MPNSSLIDSAPRSNHDPYSDDALLDPWSGYRELRNAGPAVWLPEYEMFALARYDSVRRALRGLGDLSVALRRDDERRYERGSARQHAVQRRSPTTSALRDVLIRPLMPRALRDAREQITAEAESVVDRLVAQGTLRRSVRTGAPSAGDHRLQPDRASGGRPGTDAGVGLGDVQLLRPDERPDHPFVPGPRGDDGVRHQRGRARQAQARQLGRGNSRRGRTGRDARCRRARS